MTTRELIEAEIEHLDEEQLDEVYRVVQELAHSKKPASFLRTARSLNLEGPADWSTNLDTYLYGEEAQDGG